MTRVVCLSVLVVSLVALSGCSATKQSYVAKGNKLFAAGKYGAPTPTGADTSTVVTGLFYGGGWGVLKAQMIGSFSVTIATFATAMVLMYAVKYAFRLRIPTEGEIEGLDLHEHGFPAYPEYVVTGEDGCPKTIDDVPVGRRTQYKLPKIRSKEVA